MMWEEANKKHVKNIWIQQVHNVSKRQTQRQVTGFTGMSFGFLEDSAQVDSWTILSVTIFLQLRVAPQHHYTQALRSGSFVCFVCFLF